MHAIILHNAKIVTLVNLLIDLCSTRGPNSQINIKRNVIVLLVQQETFTSALVAAVHPSSSNHNLIYVNWTELYLLLNMLKNNRKQHPAESVDEEDTSTYFSRLMF